MVSRVRVAAAACLMVSGLFVGGAGGALAFANPDETDGAGGAGTIGGTIGDAPSDAAGPTAVDGTGSSRPDRPGRHPQPPRVVIGNGRGAAPSDAGESTRGGTSSKQSETVDRGPGGASSGAAGERNTGAGASPPALPPVTAQPPLGSTLPSTVADPPDPGLDPENPDDPEDPDDPDDCDENGHHCLPWWWPKPVVVSPGNGNGGVGSGAPKPPSGRPSRPPVMRLPAPAPQWTPNGEVPVVPALPDVVDILPGLAAGVPLPPVSVPQIVVPPAAGGGGGGAAAGGSGAPPPAAPRAPSAPRSPAEPPRSPIQAVDNPVVPASYRVGYGEYLRTAGISQVVAVAAPGFAGIMLLTGAGGIIGYRQARSALASRSARSARFTS